MTPALIGFFGVIAGALVTGGVQGYQVRSERRLRGRAAARMLHATVTNAQLSVEILTDGVSGEHERMDRHLADWHEHRNALVAVMPPSEFEFVAGFFLRLDRIRGIHAQIEGTILGSRKRDSAPGMGSLLEKAGFAAEISSFYLALASRTWLERRRMAQSDLPGGLGIDELRDRWRLSESDQPDGGATTRP